MTKMILIEEAVVKQALEALELVYATCDWHTDDGNEAMQKASAALTAIKQARSAPVPDYAWPTVADYEKDVGFEVNEAFKMAWAMARTTNALFTQMGEP